MLFTSSRDAVTRVEDLSNEVIYEMFDFLDFCQIYDAFSHLNVRLENLLHDPLLPIKIKIALVSKPTFQRYYTQIIIPNVRRIQSLHLSNPFIIDFVFSLLSMLSKFTRLECLVLHKIKVNCLENNLIHLRSLLCLSSLVIDCIGYVQSRQVSCRSIFRLSQLKYCKISLLYEYFF